MNERHCEQRLREERRDKDREAETSGTDQQGCGERSLISQHHLLPVPGLKAPLMSNLPQPHSSRAHRAMRDPHCLFLVCPLHRFMLCNSQPTHPPTTVYTTKHSLAEINESVCFFLGRSGLYILLRKIYKCMHMGANIFNVPVFSRKKDFPLI